MVSLHIQGIDAIIHNLDVLEEAVLDGVLDAVKQAGEKVRQRVSDKAPKRTGKLKQNIIGKYVRKGKDGAWGRIGGNKSVWYGIFPEIGAYGHGKKPYLFPALQENYSNIIKIVGSVIWKITKRSKLGMVKTQYVPK
jgi:HK97 gp10 family phage protein